MSLETTSSDIDRPEADASRPGRFRSRPRLIDTILCVVLGLASLLLGVWITPQHATVSPIDEYVYIDYLAKVPTQIIVHKGEETGQYARLYLSCHGVRTIGFYPDSFCEHWTAADVARMPNTGKTTADLYTPLYFGATWLMAQPLRLFGITDITEAGRLTGWTWLAAGAILLYLSLRRLRVHPATAAGLGLLMVGSLSAYWSNTYISTDATSLLAGSLMLFGLTMLSRPGRRGAILFVVFGVLVTLAKLQNLMAVAAAVLILLIMAANDAFRSEGVWRERTRTFFRDRRVLIGAIALVASLVGQVIWILIRNALTVGTFPDQGVSTPFGKKAFVDEVFKFFPGVANGAIQPSQVGFAAVIAATLMTWVIVAGVLGLLAASKRGTQHEALALGSFVVALLAGPILAVANIAVSGYYFSLPPRYGMSLIPFFLACAGVLFTRAVWTRYLAPAVGLASYVAVMSIPG
ncbi:hypothetical protein ABCS02_16480 [Microbacterium sp. X-17]|uniref:hypothetical protein n=1 Tax=Microbacterium sp. X-17 TaxID=3144404 RepID=UPI0031F47F60